MIKNKFKFIEEIAITFYDIDDELIFELFSTNLDNNNKFIIAPKGLIRRVKDEVAQEDIITTISKENDVFLTDTYVEAILIATLRAYKSDISDMVSTLQERQDAIMSSIINNESGK